MKILLLRSLAAYPCVAISRRLVALGLGADVWLRCGGEILCGEPASCSGALMECVAEAGLLRAVLVNGPCCRVVMRALVSGLGTVVLLRHHAMTFPGAPWCSLGGCN